LETKRRQDKEIAMQPRGQTRWTKADTKSACPSRWGCCTSLRLIRRWLAAR